MCFTQLEKIPSAQKWHSCPACMLCHRGFSSTLSHGDSLFNPNLSLTLRVEEVPWSSPSALFLHPAKNNLNYALPSLAESPNAPKVTLKTFPSSLCFHVELSGGLFRYSSSLLTLKPILSLPAGAVEWYKREWHIHNLICWLIQRCILNSKV